MRTESISTDPTKRSQESLFKSGEELSRVEKKMMRVSGTFLMLPSKFLSGYKRHLLLFVRNGNFPICNRQLSYIAHICYYNVHIFNTL